MTAGGVPEFLMMLSATMSAVILFAFFPLIGIIAGWYTQNKIAAVLAGALPFPCFMIAGILLSGPSAAQPGWFMEAVLYYSILAGVGGFAGYLASFHTKKNLIIALAFTIIWVTIFLSGIR